MSDRDDKGYRLFVNQDSTVLVRIWNSGKVEVVLRTVLGDVWEAPIELTEQP